jgi:hypothetical protein
MKLFRVLIIFSVLIFFVTCETYDASLIYHKNFEPGTHSLLRLDGYYSDSIPGLSEQNGIKTKLVKPVFLYSNGSAFATNNNTSETDLPTLVKTNRLFGSWGNYLVSADTILFERFQKIENNYVRIILRGIISKDQIHWTARKYHREKFKPVDYSIFYHPFSAKPDSTQNFTRTLEIYNKK